MGRFIEGHHHMHVTLVTKEQQESLIDLLCEINAYYNPETPADRSVVRDHAVRNLFSPSSPHQLVVAADSSGRVIGLAAITLVYSLVEPEKEKRCHCQLKELYVMGSHRNRGAGRALMAWVAKYAVEHSCHRIDWPVKAANAKGILFYKGLGATQVEDRLSFRITGSAVAHLAASSGGGPSDVQR